jgi:hypothetical protein
MQLLLRIGMTSVLLSWSWAAYADPSQRIAESYVCLNNPASECRKLLQRLLVSTISTLNAITRNDPELC